MNIREEKIGKREFLRFAGRTLAGGIGAMAGLSIRPQTTYGSELSEGPLDMTSIPIYQGLETASVYDKEERERMRVYFPKTSANPLVGKAYFLSDPTELQAAGISFSSFHPDQAEITRDVEIGLFVDAIFAKSQNREGHYDFTVTMRKDKMPKGFYTIQFPFNPVNPALFNFNWDNFHIFDVQLNRQDIKGNPFVRTYE